MPLVSEVVNTGFVQVEDAGGGAAAVESVDRVAVWPLDVLCPVLSAFVGAPAPALVGCSAEPVGTSSEEGRALRGADP
jgi:hypothetical protein